MPNITVICVGTLKESYLTEAVREYEKRISAYAKLSVVALREERIPDNPTPAEARIGMEREGERILAAIPQKSYVWALCIDGKQCSSPEFAGRIADIRQSGRPDITFIIGGSMGLSDAVVKRADARLSFSPMTFPHQLMRVILLEQIYRAENILAGGKYHK